MGFESAVFQFQRMNVLTKQQSSTEITNNNDKTSVQL